MWVQRRRNSCKNLFGSWFFFFFPLESRIELLYQLAMCLVHGCGTEQIFFPQLHIYPTALPSAMCGMEANTDAGSPHAL